MNKSSLRKSSARARRVLGRVLVYTFALLALLATFGAFYTSGPSPVLVSAVAYVPKVAPVSAAVYVAPSPKVHKRRARVRRRAVVAPVVDVAQTCPCVCESGLVKTAGK